MLMAQSAEEIFLRHMGKGQMAQVMTESRHPQYSSPIGVVRVALSGNEVKDVGADRFADLVKHQGGERHHPQRVLKAGVGCPRINKVGDSQLMDVVEPLEREGVDQLFFKLIE